MRSSHARHPTHHHSLLLAAAAIAVSVILIRRQSSSSNRRCSDGKEGTENNENEKNEDAAPTDDRKSDSTRFPWEPAVMTNVNESGDTCTSDDVDDIGEESGHVSTGNPTHHQQQQGDQLEFLASMTFASSSLRQPSCPCCV